MPKPCPREFREDVTAFDAAILPVCLVFFAIAASPPSHLGLAADVEIAETPSCNRPNLRHFPSYFPITAMGSRMGSMVDEPFGAAVPSVPLSRSPLSFVVVQVRFPLVASISEESFIGPFQERLRGSYGDLRREDEAQVMLGPDGVRSLKGGVVWRFSDGPDGWEIALAPEFVALATSHYTNREDFRERLEQMTTALDEWLSPPKVRRLGVRYIDRVQEQDHLQRLGELLRPEILGPHNVVRPEAVTLNSVLTDCDYRFSDESALRARWGFLGPRTTFDPAIAPVDSPSWVLDLDASHGERDFDVVAISDQVQLFTDRIYRYFRWAVTDEFLAAFGADR
jgi:uncharacterized protein (TIGR04255 family)